MNSDNHRDADDQYPENLQHVLRARLHPSLLAAGTLPVAGSEFCCRVVVDAAIISQLAPPYKQNPPAFPRRPWRIGTGTPGGTPEATQEGVGGGLGMGVVCPGHPGYPAHPVHPVKVVVFPATSSAHAAVSWNRGRGPIQCAGRRTGHVRGSLRKVTGVCGSASGSITARRSARPVPRVSRSFTRRMASQVDSGRPPSPMGWQRKEASQWQCPDP